ncbi:MAG: IS110 family transposase [Gemmatimonadaceae bacterium]|nr:IS110 family transposase [Chitinophagaceae bacterium]
MAKLLKQTQGPVQQLAVLRHDTAGIDVGSMLMMVSYTDTCGNQCLAESTGFTSDIIALAKTLKESGVKHVAMEATGVYWMSFYEVLENHGLEVILTNPRHFKNVAAQKTDVKDCQWIHQLHAHGLLRASHIATEVYRELKSYLHERTILQKQKSDTLNRIHRVLTLMNIKVQHLISDIEGVAGMQLLRAIAGGIQDAKQLLGMINIKALKATAEDLELSLQGFYKEQFVSILGHQLAAYDFYKAEMKAYETLIEKVLIKLLGEEQDALKPVARKTKYVRKNQYSINLKEYLQRILGTDVTQVDGLDEISVLEIMSVTGKEMQKWPTAEHFVSWLNLDPRPKKSGGKMLGHQKRFTSNVATQAFRMAAQTMWSNKGALGQLYRRLAAKKGAKIAIKAVARKLAVIYYHMVKNKSTFDKQRLQMDPRQDERRKIAKIRKMAERYGFGLQPITVTSL